MPQATNIPSLLTLTDNLAARLPESGEGQGPEVRARLLASVVRPLRLAIEPGAEGSGITDDGADRPSTLDGEIWELARDATALAARPAAPPGLTEATAALQDLTLTLSGEDSVATRLEALETLQAGWTEKIQTASDGPYLVTNAESLTDWLAQSIPVRPQMALCRCGASSNKPFCDGTHAEIGFDDAKDPKRVPDQQDTYVGQQVTILDNRGICQHSGFCTDRLASVFHADSEPFVTPSGGRMDEIIRAVRDCPSGALSYALDGVEARSAVDYHGKRPSHIEVSQDGPYRVTGGVPLIDAEDQDVERAEGASLEHYALCRCGQSQNKPFCSGMHWYVEFRDPVFADDYEPSVYEWAGGYPALLRMTRLFYEKLVPPDPLLGPLFSTMSADHPERVASWLGEVFAGPKSYSEKYGGYAHMIAEHMGRGLTEEARARWVTLLLQAAHEIGLPNDAEFRSAFGGYIEWGSRLAFENSQSGAEPPANMPMPHWDWTTTAGPPGSRISALAKTTEDDAEDADAPEAELPGLNEEVLFAEHVKSLFREKDRQSMKFAFDLWKYEDVQEHADDILRRVSDGSMPCDGAWPEAKVDTFKRWVESGMAP